MQPRLRGNDRPGWGATHSGSRKAHPLKSLSLFASSLLVIGWTGALHAQDTAQANNSPIQQEEEEAFEPGAIVVTGERIRGQLVIDEPPVAEYDSEDIAAFGGSSIADIIDAIEPATGGARGSRAGGRPVFLINGIRVSSFREFRSYPPESVEKIEVFAEEVAQRFGYDPDQRVVNIVLKNNYSALTAEGELEAPTSGGFSRNEEELTYLRIADGARLNFNLDVEDRSMLTEAERGFVVTSDIPGAGDEAPFRSLLADTWAAEATANYARAFIESGSSISLNVTAGREESTSLSGLRDMGTDFQPFGRRSRTDTLSLGGAYNRSIGDWKATFTSDAVLANSDTEIDQQSGTGFDIAETRTRTIVNKATLTGYPVELPAGDMAVTIDAGLDWKRLESFDTRSDSDGSITRRRFDGGINLNIPIARRDGAWGGIGTASLNLAAGAEDLSDFGSLTNWTAGLNWSPFDGFNLQATRIWREVAPSISALGDPRIDEFNVPVFDFLTGQDVLATVITGGNPNLAQETQSDWKFGANWELPFWENPRLQVDYGINRSRDVTLSSPSYTAAFEQAFPDRVTRDTNGELLAIDRRPVTLYETRAQTLSFGLSTRGRIGGSDRSERSESTPSQAPRNRGEGRQGFDPDRFAQMRQQFCATPADGTPDISQLPDRMRERLVDEAGNPDPARIAAARERMCSADGEAGQERFAEMRAAVCADPPQLDNLPEAMLARLRGEDGEIDQQRLQQMRERFCSADGGAAGEASGERGGGQGAAPNPFARRGGDGGGRYFVNGNHTIALQNEITLAQGGPVYDQLDGLVIGSGAIPKHTSRLEAGMFLDGYGARISGNYLGEAVLQGTAGVGSSDLFFGDLVTFDLRLFADLGQIFEREDGLLNGLRVSLMMDNIFDGQRRVTDANGVVPDAYDPRRIDPIGRYIGVEVRKMF